MKRLLVVDDSRVAFEILSHALANSEKYRVEYFCRNGEKLFETYEKQRPDIVIMDIVMCGMDGIDLTRQLKTAYPEACVVIVTAMGYPDMQHEAAQAGADGFVQKPIQSGELISTLDRILEQRGQR